MTKSTIALLSLAILFFSTNSYAQKSNYFEFLGGLSSVSMTKGNLENDGRTAANARFDLGYNLGIRFSFIGKKHLGWGLGLFYSKEGFKKEFIGAGSNFYLKHNPSYLKIPVNIYCICGDPESKVHPILFGGLSLGLLLADNEKVWNKTNTLKSYRKLFAYKTLDFGAQLGFGLKIDLNSSTSLLCSIKGYQGLTDVLTEDHHLIVDSENNMNQSIGFQFGIMTKI